MVEINSILNKTILIGLTYLDESGKETDKEQFIGTITKADKKIGIVVYNKKTQRKFTLPPDLDAIEIAPPGIYTLKSSQETVANPDFITTWTIRQK